MTFGELEKHPKKTAYFGKDRLMKLNYRRTVYCGFAFLLICAFWQAYDNIVPMILTYKFGMSQTWSGIIMALDNILALFMLPLFGAISDKSKNKHGKRKPFVLVGTIAAVAALICLTFADMSQVSYLKKGIPDVDDIYSKTALEELYEFDYGETKLRDPDGNEFTVKDFSLEEWLSFNDVNGDGQISSGYTSYVVPARNAYAGIKTAQDPTGFIIFVIILLAALLSMATFRSPAVALMPDITVKPLRSKANAVINLMGSVGGVMILVLGIIAGTGKASNQLGTYTLYLGILCILMLISLVIFLVKIDEPKFVAEMEKESKEYGIEDGEEESTSSGGKLSRGETASLLLILLSVVLWYFGYNAITSKYSVYASQILNKDYNLTMIIAQAAAIAAYFPAGSLSMKIGRKKAILCGVVLLGGSFGAASFMTPSSPTVIMNLLFVLCGIGWATINVNSFPMVVELAKGGDVGKYTGFYYTASMAAQTATPMLSGILMDNFGMRILFPYAAAFATLALVTMAFVRHGDSKPNVMKSKLESLDVDM